MLIRIKQMLAPPVLEDEEKTRVAGLLNTILLITIPLMLYSFVTIPTLLAEVTVGLFFLAIVIGVTVGVLILIRAGRVRLASVLFTAFLWGMTALASFRFEGVSGSAYSLYAVVILIAGLLLGGWAAIGCAGASIVLGFVLFSLESRGVISPEVGDWGLVSVFGGVTPRFVMIALLVYLYHRGFAKALTRARRNERVLAERAREIAIFRALAENAVDAILMSTLEGKITYANRMSYVMFGCDYEEQEMIGMETADLTPATENVNQQTTSTTLQVGNWRGELRHQRKDGSLFDAHDTVFSIQDETGQQVILVSIVRDITEQKQAEAEHGRLQQEVIDAQRQALLELSTPVIPVMERIIVMPLIGSIDSMRARDITRALLAGIRQQRAKVVILDITGVPIVDSGVANYLNKTIQAARLKGAYTIITGISDAVAETIVDLGIDWSGIETLSDLQTGLVVALNSLGIGLTRRQDDKETR